MATEIQEILAGMSNAQLEQEIQQAYEATVEEGTKEPNSEAHESAFAALMAMCIEANKRGLHIRRLH